MKADRQVARIVVLDSMKPGCPQQNVYSFRNAANILLGKSTRGSDYKTFAVGQRQNRSYFFRRARADDTGRYNSVDDEPFYPGLLHVLLTHNRCQFALHGFRCYHSAHTGNPATGSTLAFGRSPVISRQKRRSGIIFCGFNIDSGL